MAHSATTGRSLRTVSKMKDPSRLCHEGSRISSFRSEQQQLWRFAHLHRGGFAIEPFGQGVSVAVIRLAPAPQSFALERLKSVSNAWVGGYQGVKVYAKLAQNVRTVPVSSDSKGILKLTGGTPGHGSTDVDIMSIAHVHHCCSCRRNEGDEVHGFDGLVVLLRVASAGVSPFSYTWKNHF